MNWKPSKDISEWTDWKHHLKTSMNGLETPSKDINEWTGNIILKTSLSGLEMPSTKNLQGNIHRAVSESINSLLDVLCDHF